MGLFGYRFYRPCLFLSGYLVGGCLAYYLADRSDEFEHAAVALASGVVGGFVTSNVYPLGVATLGAVWGVAIALMMNGAIISRFGYYMGGDNSFLIVVLAVLGVLGAGLALATHPKGGGEPSLAQKMIIFIKTALPGAYLLGKGISVYIDPSIPGEFELAEHSVLPWAVWMEVGLQVFFAFSFVAIQFRITHRQQCGFEETFDLDPEHEALVITENSYATKK